MRLYYIKSMIWIILSLVTALVIVALVFFVKPSSETDKSDIKLYNRVRLICGIAVLMLWGIMTLWWSVYSLENRYVAVTSSFGSIDLDHPIADPGPFIVAPWKKVVEMEVRGLEIDVVTGTQNDESMSKDKVGLKIDVSMPYALNAQYAPHVLARVGDKEHYEARLKSSGQAALKDTVAEFGWSDSSVDQRPQFEQALLKQLRATVAAQLVGLGFSQDEAEKAFTFLPLQVKKITPQERIIVANGELAAANIDLQRQITLTAQANEIAKRREAEGNGINLMLAKLPVKNLTEDGIANIINAQAYENQANAIKSGIETGKIGQVTVVVSPTASGNPIAVK